MTDLAPKCKDKYHVVVATFLAEDISHLFGPGMTNAMHVTCNCRQEKYGEQPVVVLYARTIEQGMHCLMPLAEALPNMLRQAAAEADDNECVSIEHKVVGEWKPWRSFTKTGALDLAQKIERAITG